MLKRIGFFVCPQFFSELVRAANVKLGRGMSKIFKTKFYTSLSELQIFFFHSNTSRELTEIQNAPRIKIPPVNLGFSAMENRNIIFSSL